MPDDQGEMTPQTPPTKDVPISGVHLGNGTFEDREMPIQQGGEIVPAQQPVQGAPSLKYDHLLPTAHQELNDRVKRAEAWMIWLTGALALLALCSVLVGYFQWTAMRDQFVEIHSGSKDTTLLASAAQKQAENTAKLVQQSRAQVDRTEKLAEQMKDQADQTRRIANESKIQASAAQTAAQAALISATTGQSQLELSERPWLTVSASIAGDLKSGSFVVGSSAKVRLSIRNIGHSPATLVLSGASFWSYHSDVPYDPDDGSDALDEEKAADEFRERFCKELFLNFTGVDFGTTLFPGDVLNDTIEIESGPKRDRFASDTGLPRTVITCTAYKSSFNEHNYWLSNMYRMQQLPRNAADGSFPVGTVKAEELLLIPDGPRPVITK
jgi:hypothetical protein